MLANRSSQPSNDSSERCSKITPWGQCQQAGWNSPEGLCRSHEEWRLKGVIPDPYYERKIVEGRIQPTFDYLTEAELHALLNGRTRGDGRRVDQYVVDDPLMINERALTDRDVA